MESTTGFIAELVASSTATRDGSGQDLELIVLIEDVQDPRNLGAILRICEGAGVGKVLVRDRGAAPISHRLSSRPRPGRPSG